jgi:hypothetical protein
MWPHLILCVVPLIWPLFSRTFFADVVFIGWLCAVGGEGIVFWDSLFGLVSIAPYSILLLPHINSQINKNIDLRISVFFCERFTSGEGPQDGV